MFKYLNIQTRDERPWGGQGLELTQRVLTPLGSLEAWFFSKGLEVSGFRVCEAQKSNIGALRST